MSDEPALLQDWEPFAAERVRESARWRWGTLRVGDHVRLRPGDGADILDIALRGRIATVESIEMDYEDRVHVAVIVDDDPGRDLGVMRQPGHRFFFGLDDLEPAGPGTRGSADG